MGASRDDEAFDPIAVVGLAGRFPGAADAAAFWDNLCRGVEGVSTFSREELLAAGVPASIADDPVYVPAKGVLDGPDLFDADFFGLSPREAELMDPQQRLFLECAWEAFENAGYDPQAYPGRVAVFAGSGFNSYLTENLLSHRTRGGSGLLARLSNDKDFLTTQVSYKLNLRGPSVAVQTACSTALVATHLACQALLEGECEMALAGGVTVSFPHRIGYLAEEGGILAPDGHCRSFDAAAAGTVEANGAGAVLLKRLSRAKADGDFVHALILGSAVNNDGSGKASFTAPSVDSQRTVVAEALAVAGVRADSIGFVEAHGSATPLGDPIEVEALSRAFRLHTDRRGYCLLGSVKSSIGHADAAAGAASLIKAVGAVRTGLVPATLHFEKPNPRLDLEETPFSVNAALAPWPLTEGPGRPRRAGINSLGIGGTNVHVVVEEPPAAEPASPSHPWQLLVWSAKSAGALAAATGRLTEALGREENATAFADVAHTLRVGRKPWRLRRALVCRDAAEARAALAAGRFAEGEAPTARPVAFLFPGIGEQSPGLGAELYRGEPGFRETFDRIAGVVEPILGSKLADALWPPGLPERGEGAPRYGGSGGGFDLRRSLEAEAEPTPEEARLHATAVAHPAVFALEMALARVLFEWGIRPWAMLGYSLGQYAAACLAGVFSLEDGARLVAHRAQLIAGLPAGGMLAVPLPAAETEPLLAAFPALAVAAVNGAALTVVGGPREETARLAKALAGRGVASRSLPTTHAFHTAALAPIVPELGRLLSEIRLSPPRTPLLSNTTGAFMTGEEAVDPATWTEHLCRPVRFDDGLAALLTGGEPRLLLEVGPGQTLATLARQHPERREGQLALPALPGREAEGEEVSEQAFLLDAVGRLWTAGATPDWKGLVKRETRRRVPLPTYPFERRRHFLDPVPVQAAEPPAGGERRPVEQWFHAPVWEWAPPLAVGDEAAAGLSVLLVPPAAGAGAELARGVAAELERRGARVWWALSPVPSPGAGEGNVDGAIVGDRGGEGFPLEAGTKTGWATLFAALREAEVFPSRIVHLLSLGSAGSVDRAEETGFYSLLALGQALGESERRGPLHLTVAADGLFQVAGNDAVQPEKATLLGPLRVLPLELADLSASAVDVMAGDAGLAARLADEVVAGAGEAAVGLRGASRWVRRFRPLSPGAPAAVAKPGACLVAGGLDETGVVLAEHLFRSGHRQLALLTNPGEPARETWGEWLGAHDERDELCRRMRRVLALEAEGCEVWAQPVDLAQPDRVATAVARVRARFGRLAGAVHAAGPPGAGLALLKSREAAHAVLAPKVRGTLALAAALAGDDLAFFSLFGSSLAATGGLGQIDTVAAASFLAAFAESPAGRALGAKTVSWGFFRWHPVAVDDAQLAETLRQGLAAYGIAADELPAAWERALASPLPHLVASTQDLAFVAAQTAEAGQSLWLHPAADGSSHPRPPLATPYAAPASDLERSVAAVWQEVLGIEGVGRDDSFFELAGNSLLAIQIVTRLSSLLGLALPMASLLEAPTVAELAARIEALRPAAPAAAGSGPDDGADLESLLAEIDALSLDEARAELARLGAEGRG